MSNDAANPDEPEGQPRDGLGLVISVSLAGAVVGAFFGSFEYPLGTALGGVGGVVDGLAWTGIMLSRAQQGHGRGRLLAAGAGWGVAVGLVATFILHGGLALWHLALGRASPTDLPGVFLVLVGILCAVPVGAITGLLCGLLVPVRPPT